MKDKTQKKPNLINVVRWYLPMWMLLSVVVIIGQVFHPVIWILLSAGTFGGFLVWTDRNWRCPDCGKSLGKVMITGKVTCPHCGKTHKI